jgi:hypothetical protein
MTVQLPQQPRRPGPLGVAAKVALCLLAVFSAGLLGFVPAVLLAARRKTRVDVVGAVVICALSVLMVVCAELSGADQTTSPTKVIGETVMVVLAFGTPTYFLLMDRRSVWDRLRPEPSVWLTYDCVYGGGPTFQNQPFPQPSFPAQPFQNQPFQALPLQQPQAQPFQAQPFQQPPVQDRPAQQPPLQQPPAPDELQELGDLLRRQAQGDGR